MSTTGQDVLQVLREIIDEVAEIPAGRIGLDSAFVSDLELDSLAMVSVFVLVQRRLGVEVPNSVVEKLTSVGEAVAYLEHGKAPV
ncbi:acyl carrier protein [Saccharothrix tamanrassetensis]|uniref:Acyl carrier protein n=1 Tax=Saccharothrix tamanrassetensis TaxID=1051531 RepID=A0A841CTR0_9PSEU|nr:acyl carrier protein [Saccharothrix tamanrassetensis]MBB5959704.1 acyl carrier protein [Saccharothrix tamanrassetensis]